MAHPDADAGRFAVRETRARGFAQRYVRVGEGGVPLLAVHGWPESKRIWWRVLEPLAEAGFDVIAPDLRGFGDSEVGPPDDDRGDVVAHSRDLLALLDDLGVERAVLAAGDLGGPVIQDMAARAPERTHRMVVFNTVVLPPPDAGPIARPPREATDYFGWQATEADALAAELATPEARRRYISTFYTSRHWAHPGAFLDDPDGRWGFGAGGEVVAFHTEPFGDAATFRASIRPYEAAVRPELLVEAPLMGPNPDVEVLILHGTSDQVIGPDFDRAAAAVYPHHVGPFRLRDCGHFVPWEAPGPFTSGVRAFCRDLLAG
ncbi:alpha/beta hydrolase [Iamia majanohamensis]|uniref:Alpha/beta hydrolase n=1 Tax=Iamia majanohamensis TaxID=467976 RepID=A0AAE9YAI3_9ACTN|nr:alpha/beta hydrolase [Iamia majanohamensis]WCO67424.1 alpha/beta hydrolase [Iamia majanohamensis]